MMAAVTCMAVAIYFEARNQPVAGQLAVAYVISNRVASKHYPGTVCEVIQQGPVHKSGHPVKHRCQFSFWCDGKPETVQDYNAWQTAVRVATIVAGTGISKPERMAEGETPAVGVDVSEGATHYHTTDVSPKWRYTMQMTAHIGDHLFYKP